jgi:recombination protein RecA
MAISAAEEKELKKALTEIEKAYGKGAIMQLGEKTGEDVQGIATGALSLDVALGGKGLPRGRIVEIYGPEASGKTTVTLHAVANAQKSGGVAAFIDAEHALDPGWAKRIGVDLESLLVSQPGCAEEALRIAEMLVKSNSVDIIVIDSVAALVPRVELEGDIGDTHVGLQARLMSQALRILTPAVAKTRTCLVFINQLRSKVGVMFGNPETTAGGNALKYYASVRLDIRKMTGIKDGEETVGTRVKVKVVKNKVAPPFRGTELDLMHTNGISWEGDLIDMAVEDEVLRKSGAYFYYGTQSFQGRENFKEHLRQHPEMVAEIRQKVLDKRGLLGGGAPVAPAGPVEGEIVDEPAPAPAPPPKRGRGKAAPVPAPVAPASPDESEPE